MNSWSLTIQMKATEQYIPVVLFIMLYMVVLTFESVDEILKSDHSNESYWAILSSGTVYYAIYVLTFVSVDEASKCDHSNESYWAVLSSGAVYYAVLGGSILSLWMNSWSLTIQMKAIKQYIPVVLFIMLYMVVLTFESIDELRKSDHSNESYWAVLFWLVFVLLPICWELIESDSSFPNQSESVEKQNQTKQLKLLCMSYYHIQKP